MPRKQEFRQSIAVPATINTYSTTDFIAFGIEGSGQAPDPGFLGVTAGIESNDATGAILEIWLPKAAAPTTPGIVTIADYYYAGWSITTGAITQALASYRGALIRVKSGGVAGTMVVSASAD